MYHKGQVRREERITLRIPTALKAALEREAQRDRRSVADIVIPVLEAAFVAVPPTKKGAR